MLMRTVSECLREFGVAAKIVERRVRVERRSKASRARWAWGTGAVAEPILVPRAENHLVVPREELELRAGGARLGGAGPHGEPSLVRVLRCHQAARIAPVGV